MAYVEPSRRAPQHNAPAPAAQMPRTQSDRKHLGVHARQLAIQSHLQILRRYRRSLLRFLEQAHRSAMAHHVHRLARLGSWVLVSEGWYKIREPEPDMNRETKGPLALTTPPTSPTGSPPHPSRS